MSYLGELKLNLSASVASALDVDPDEVTVEDANEKIGADLAVPMFKFASKLSKSPNEIAAAVASQLKNDDFEKIESAGGFVNVWIKANSLATELISDAKQQDYGTSHEGKGKTIIVDFIGLNLSKPFMVGHLRPTVQGWALIQIYKALGYEVIGDSHLGDWGTPFGMWVVGFEEWGSDEALEKDGAYELGRLYIKFREEAKENEELLVRAKAWLKKLEAGDQDAIEYRDRFYKISTDHAESVLSHLNVKADENLGESYYIEGAQKLVDQLVRDGVAVQQDDNSVVVDLSDKGLETPILLRKSDGSALYATSDVEAIRYRLERWNPAKIIYSVGSEQQFHFNQVFALSEKLGYTKNTELKHAWFGTIDEIDEQTGKRSKMSSRKKIALLEELLKIARAKAKDIVQDEKGLSQDDIEAIAIGAIKYNDFAQPRQTNILFDWERMFSLQGHSAAYIQYAAVRVNSILSGIDATEAEFGDYDWQAERELLLQLSKYPETVKNAADTYEPFEIAQYCYDLARIWNRYYENTPVRQADGEVLSARTWLIGLLSTNFTHAMGLLGIKIPNKM